MDDTAPPAEPSPIPEPPPTEPEGLPERMQRHKDVADLCVALYRAVGVDPDANQGFRLTVIGGQIPQLEVYPIPFAFFDAQGEQDGTLADPWSNPLRDALLPTTYALLPGGATSVEVQAPEILPPDLVAPEVRDDHVAARLLVMMSDVLNGAGCSADMRDWMTSAAHTLNTRFADRVFRASPPRQASPQRLAEAAAARDEAIRLAMAGHPELTLRREENHVVLVLPGDAGVVHLPDSHLWKLAVDALPEPPTNDPTPTPED